MRKAGVFLATLLFSLGVFSQKNIIHGKVICCDSQNSLKNCKIEILELEAQKLTSNKDGEFSFENLPNGRFSLLIQHQGYKEKIIPVDLTKKDEICLNVEVCEDQYLNLSEVMVSASRVQRKLKDEPITVQVIDAKTIEKAQIPNFNDFLEQELAGVKFDNNGGYANINMLGFDGKYVLFLIDGERMAGETFDNIDYNRIDINNIERVEIIKGASSSLYGSNAIGGVINIITKKPNNPLQISAASQYGSLNEQNHNLSIGSKLKWGSIHVSSFFKKADPYLLKDIEPLRQEYTSGKTTESPLQQSYVAGYMNYGINPKINFNLSPKVKNEIYGGYYFQERNEGGLDGYKIRDQFHNYRIGAKSEISINSNNHLSFSASLDDYQKFKFYKLLDEREQNYDNMILRVSGIYDHNIKEKHANIIGIDVFSEDLLTYMFNSEGTNSRQNAQNYAVFAQQEWKLTDKFTVVTGERFDYHSQFKGFPTFRLSGMYQFTPLMTMRGGYSGGFRSPTLKELYTDWFHPYGGGFQIVGNPSMKAEKSHNLNISFDYRYKKFDFTVMGQYSSIDEKIDLIWLSSDTVQYQNIGHANVISTEFSAAYRFPFNLHLSGTYSFVNQTPKKESVVRPHSLTVKADYTPKFIEKYAPTLTLSGKFTSGMTIFGTVDLEDSDNSVGIDQNKEEYRVYYEPYSIWRLQLATPLPYNFSMGIGVNNLFNYVTKFSSFYSNISPGRTYYISLKWNFNLEKREKYSY